MPAVSGAVDVISSRLRGLLHSARKIKSETAIEPPLQPVDFQDPCAHIGEPQAGEEFFLTSPHHAALETAARDIFYLSLAKHSIDEPDFVDIWNLLDIVQLCANHEQCDPCLSLWLIEELLDSQTIDGCRRVFDYLESRRERLITASPSRNKQMIILRSCNELLRRLSRAEDAVFCGRVFIFLFQSFPLGDKSSVNLRGEFHVENTTTFDWPKAKDGPENELDQMEVEESANTADPDSEMTDQIQEVSQEDATDQKSEMNGHENSMADEEAAVATQNDGDKPMGESAKTVTFEATEQVEQKDDKKEADVDTLYIKFWSLQHIYSNPPKLFNKEDFDSFKEGLELTLEKFKAVPKVMPHDVLAEAEENAKGPQRDQAGLNDEFASNFNPKYLTSRDLFELELSDTTFQRHILVQALILIDFLLSLTLKAKRKVAELKAQKAMVYNYTLSDEDANWVTNMKSQIVAYLKEGPDGNFYYRMVDNVLSRDKNWVRWKVESCPPIEMPPLPAEKREEARQSGKKAFASRRIRETPMGSMDLSFLTDTGKLTGFEMLKKESRWATPPMDKYVKEVENVDLDLEMASTPGEKETLTERRSAGTWRALRLASRTNLKLFDKINESDTKTLKLLDDSFVEAEPSEKVEKSNEAESGDVATPAGPEIKVDDEMAVDEPKVEEPATVREMSVDRTAQPNEQSIEETASADVPSIEKVPALDENMESGVSVASEPEVKIETAVNGASQNGDANDVLIADSEQNMEQTQDEPENNVDTQEDVIAQGMDKHNSSSNTAEEATMVDDANSASQVANETVDDSDKATRS